MAHIIIGLNGRYNIFSTVVDAPMFEKSLSEEELRDIYRNNCSLEEFEQRLLRCKETGTSALNSWFSDLRSLVRTNRAGINEANLSYKLFVNKYLK